MVEGPITHPGVPEEQYHTLGKKTLMFFFLGRVSGGIVLFLVAACLFIVSGQPFLKNVLGRDMGPFAMLLGWWVLGLAVLGLLVAFIISWFVYNHYKFFLGEDSLKIKRGILDKEEIAIPYRQIQDVDIERSLNFQMFGLSRIVILTAGHEDEKPQAESEGILPAIDKDLAEWIQAQLLQRANVQKVTEEKS